MKSRTWKFNLDSVMDAKNVLDNLEKIIQDYGSCSVGDLYDLLGIGANFVDSRWGWKDSIAFTTHPDPEGPGQILETSFPEYFS